ncbi:hypothetical protein [Sulfuriferula sp.]|uniref:hypothetical protein n=1 Tax=Sulfuriferula sp. TaxID=2025307 RepID=UPI002730B35B|nr:hypothetical protein [Sulfuriferula sp.]MDP2026308.1 hypothetical protein [Sulfuriferula sp.]
MTLHSAAERSPFTASSWWVTPLSDASWNRLFLAGLVLMSLQWLQVSIVQFQQLWAVLALALLIQRAEIRAGVTETLVFAMFLGFALVATFFSGYPHIKMVEQIMKFGFLYPAFYLVGRALGTHYLQRKLPFGYTLLWIWLLLQYAVQYFQVPFIYHPVGFMQDVLYGTFKERNWLAIFFFLTAYALFLQSSRTPRDVLNFAAVGVAVALLSGSKSILIPVGIVTLLQVPGRWGLKTILVVAGTSLYIWLFGSELSGQLLQVRLQDERGLAYLQSVHLLSENWLGYGFGFVEAYFSNLWFVIKGLGVGVNSVFSAPLDLLLIAGIPGLIFWAVFFLGIGLRSVSLLLPIAAWSLINPLHQSEITYLFIGFLVAWGLQKRVLYPAQDKGDPL